jgi:hypothetical protein
MAKRTAKKHQAQELTAQIRLDVRSDTPSYYVNFIAVSHTAYDFTLTAAKIPSPLTEEQIELAKSGKQIPVEPILQVVMPPLVAEGLIKALTDQKAKHARTLEQQVKNNEIQHQHIKPVDSIN